MTIKQVLNKGFVPVKIWSEDLDSVTLDQLVNVSQMPFIYKWVAAMPDAHLGKGATIGTVIATDRAIIPAAVGVDIGCGMMAVQTNLTSHDLSESLKDIRGSIERGVPLGAGGQKTVNLYEFLMMGIPEQRHKAIHNLIIKFNELRGLNSFIKKKNWDLQLGTLGSGNHFIEICLDESDSVWVMLHSGSRGIGNMIGTHFIALAKKEMERFMINLPDKDLAYLPEGSEHFEDYVNAVSWAQDYAKLNRELMMDEVMRTLKHYIPHVKTTTKQAINCHHNYVEKEHHYGKNVWLTRKGAIRAREGDLGIIPGSMGTKSYIVKGKGNPESFNSCSHGAGRNFSRSKAKEIFTEADLKEAMIGIEYNHRKNIIDEIPGAYKDIDKVMENQKDLVEPLHTLKQIISVKGD